jgi:hypothetical protein
LLSYALPSVLAAEEKFVKMNLQQELNAKSHWYVHRMIGSKRQLGTNAQTTEFSAAWPLETDRE